MLFLANELPSIPSDNGAWRRIVMLTFPESFEGREDLDLPAKLEAELSGILWWAIEGLIDLEATGHFTIGKNVRMATADFREESDHVRAFAKDYCIFHEYTECPKEDVYFKYNSGDLHIRDFCRAHGFKPKNEVHFWRAMHLLHPELKIKFGFRSDDDKHRIRFVSGMTLASDDQLDKSVLDDDEYPC